MKCGLEAEEMSIFMEKALAEAKLAATRGEVPIGAVIVKNSTIIASDGNRTIENKDPTAHAEMLVIRAAAAKLGSERLIGCDMYVTLEPCPMCASAISFARIARLYYGAEDAKSGGVDNGVRFYSNPTCHHRPEVYSNLSADAAAQLLRDFFQNRR